jgi:hypothetical protein
MKTYLIKIDIIKKFYEMIFIDIINYLGNYINNISRYLIIPQKHI